MSRLPCVRAALEPSCVHAIPGVLLPPPATARRATEQFVAIGKAEQSEGGAASPGAWRRPGAWPGMVLCTFCLGPAAAGRRLCRRRLPEAIGTGPPSTMQRGVRRAQTLSLRHDGQTFCSRAEAASLRMAAPALRLLGLRGRSTCFAARVQESEEQRLLLDQEARDGMEAYMLKIEELAEQGNIRAQMTAWKWKVRRKVWNYLEDNDLADFPRPVHHRIPNFKGSTEAGKRVAELPEFLQAQVVKVNPDTPQKAVRVAVLDAQKTLYVPQPRLRTGFFSRILPGGVPRHKFNFAATAGGMKQLATPMTLEDRTKVDLIVVGSSAVNPENGARVGKGEGFAELEYGMMRQLGMVDESTPVVTCVHDCQVITKNMPPEGKQMMQHDVPVDIIVTPTQVLRVDRSKRLPKPVGIYWELLSEQKLAQIKVLRTLKDMIERQTGTKLRLAEQEEALPPLAKRETVIQERKRGQPGSRAGDTL